MSTIESPAPAVMGETDSAPVNVEWIAQLLAPEIRFHSKEEFFPCTLEWLLARSQLTYGRGDLSWSVSGGAIYIPSSMNVVNVGPLTPSDLVAATKADPGGDTNTEYGLWPMAAAPGEHATYSHPNPWGSFYFSDYQLETLTGELVPGSVPNPRSGAACYAHISEVTTGEGAPYFLISYYFLCAYNGAMVGSSWTAQPLAPVISGGGFEQHFGDVMRVGARVTVDASGVNLLGVEFDAHGNTRYVTEPPFSFSNLQLNQIRPLTVYSAWHSHEMYPSAGEWPLQSFPLGHDYTDDDGLHWQTRPTLVLTKAGVPEWIDYNGRLGNNVHYKSYSQAVEVLTTGPTGPAFKSDWTRGPDYTPPAITPYQQRILETGTTFAPENDGTWLMADWDHDGVPDLVFIKTANTGTGTVEVHIASGTSNFQQRILEVGTTFAPEDDGTWLMADWDGDGILDLIFIKTADTDTGAIEVHIASGASNFQQRILEVGTAFTAPGPNGTWLLADFDGDGIPDLVFIETSGTNTGTVEVHVASGASHFQQHILDTGTTFAPEEDGAWTVARFQDWGFPDLVFIKTANTGTGTVEVHVAAGD